MGETVACAYADFPDHFGFFLPLAGITTVKQLRDSSIDIRATSRLNRLYVELLKDNLEWGTAERRPDMNHFMARLIFCFFAEDTDIFGGTRRFTTTVEQMSAKDSSNTREVIGTIFVAMNMKGLDRGAAGIPRWADQFPYVNGGLFSGSMDVPRFSRIARAYLLHIGNLDWAKINPDIFGSMIQAVAEDEERGALGMHYTSVPNILKVLNPLFLDDLRARLDEAGDNLRMLLNLRKRMSRIRIHGSRRSETAEEARIEQLGNFELYAGQEVVQPINLVSGQGIALAAPVGHRLSNRRHDQLRKARPALFQRCSQELYDCRALAARYPHIANPRLSGC